MKPKRIGPHERVIIRDVGIFLIKLWLDGIKDFGVTFLAIGAAGVDLVRGRGPNGLLFYRVIRMSERFDLWLNLHGAAEKAQNDEEGFFGASRSGDSTFLGKLEDLTGGERGSRDHSSDE